MKHFIAKQIGITQLQLENNHQLFFIIIANKPERLEVRVLVVVVAHLATKSINIIIDFGFDFCCSKQ